MEHKEATSLQQLWCLLWDIISTLFSSFFYSFPLGFRAVVSSSHKATTGKRGAVTLYEGRVFHERRSPVLHKFAYNVRYALVDLDCAPPCFTSTVRHHMSAAEARAFAGTTGPVYLLTIPTSVGYEQNPLSVYYCFNDDETCLSICIAEVTNTPWAERVTFIFDPKADIVAKPLHVSPFMDMSGAWRIKTSLSARELSITITVQHPEQGNYFTACLIAERVDCALTDLERSFWLMPHKIALGIYWQAFLLWWKGIRFCQHPKYIDGDAYRDCAIQREQELFSVPVQEQQEIRPSEGGGTDSRSSQKPKVCMFSKSGNRRSCTWREADWPWR